MFDDCFDKWYYFVVLIQFIQYCAGWNSAYNQITTQMWIINIEIYIHKYCTLFQKIDCMTFIHFRLQITITKDLK